MARQTEFEDSLRLLHAKNSSKKATGLVFRQIFGLVTPKIVFRFSLISHSMIVTIYINL